MASDSAPGYMYFFFFSLSMLPAVSGNFDNAVKCDCYKINAVSGNFDNATDLNIIIL